MCVCFSDLIELEERKLKKLKHLNSPKSFYFFLFADICYAEAQVCRNFMNERREKIKIADERKQKSSDHHKYDALSFDFPDETVITCRLARSLLVD